MRYSLEAAEGRAPAWCRSHLTGLLTPHLSGPQHREAGRARPSTRRHSAPRAPRCKPPLSSQPPAPCGPRPGSTGGAPPNAPWCGRRRSSETGSWTETADSSPRRRGSVRLLQLLLLLLLLVAVLLWTCTNLRKSTGACTPLSYCTGADAARVCGLHCPASWRNKANQVERNSAENQRSRDLTDSAHTFPWSSPQTRLLAKPFSNSWRIKPG